MAHGGGNERETLGKFVRNQSGYGTTVTTAKKHSHHKSTKYIKHFLCQGDTLMGLSLKYHVTVEVLKRENKLWNNDMLFFREHVLIPLTPDNENMVDSGSIITVSERDRSGSGVSNGSHSSTSDREASVEVPAGKEEEAEGQKSVKKDNPLDFLNKYDSNIAKLKSDVAKMKTNAEFIERMDNHNPLQFMARKGSTSSQGSRRTVSFEESNPSSPVLVIRSRTQARIVQDSLEKNQRANDDLFEL